MTIGLMERALALSPDSPAESARRGARDQRPREPGGWLGAVLRGSDRNLGPGRLLRHCPRPSRRTSRSRIHWRDSAGTILPENQATNAWRATDTPRHGQDDGSFRTSGPARKILAPPSSFEAALPVSPSPGRGISRKDDGAMSLFARLLQAVRSWRRRRGGPKTVRYADISMEQLDHRQLLSVTFTGVVPTDFPASKIPGVVTLPAANVSSQPGFSEPQFGSSTLGQELQSIIKVSGFFIQDIRVTYTPFDDTLSFGINQPPSINQPGDEVIAGDSDNNGNSGTVNPIISTNGVPPLSGLQPLFTDPADWGGTKNMGVFLNFATAGATAQVAAGFNSFPPSDGAVKTYQVYIPQVPGAPQTIVGATLLPQFAGNVYTVNDPARGNLEFSIAHFSQLYQDITGKPLTPNTVIYVGGFAGSDTDFPISKAFIPSQPVLISAATSPSTCPPASPPILINPHEHRGIDTAHRDLVRVTVEGTSGFDVTSINPATVELNGALPIAEFTRRSPHSEFLNETFVFVGSDISLPAGYTTATFTAQTFSGQQITSSKQVLNIPFSAKVPGRLHFLMDKGTAYPGLRRLQSTQPGSVNLGNTTQPLPASVNVNLTSRAAIRDLRVSYRDQVSTTGTTTPVALPRTVVSLATRREDARASKA